jgi:hypothetical protein
MFSRLPEHDESNKVETAAFIVHPPKKYCGVRTSVLKDLSQWSDLMTSDM